ncbi:SH2 domain-containing protein [Porphyromonas macacae]|uniref:hypothetical protein n=1 Tax=Porphyromonas macacae TaxID=28115 RepID=UPI000690FC28|nr:hypothetical protein [Porphyromonas macacae]
MKTLKILLYGVLLLAVAAGIFALKCYLSPIEIYEMPINAWKRKVWNIPGPTRKEENLVIYNHLGKSEQQIRDAVIAYNDRTVSIDTIKKYRIYSRDFFKRDRTLNKHYTEEPDGSDIIFDHAERGVFSIRWEKDRCDSLGNATSAPSRFTRCPLTHGNGRCGIGLILHRKKRIM